MAGNCSGRLHPEGGPPRGSVPSSLTGEEWKELKLETTPQEGADSGLWGASRCHVCHHCHMGKDHSFPRLEPGLERGLRENSPSTDPWQLPTGRGHSGNPAFKYQPGLWTPLCSEAVHLGSLPWGGPGFPSVLRLPIPKLSLEATPPQSLPRPHCLCCQSEDGQGASAGPPLSVGRRGLLKTTSKKDPPPSPPTTPHMAR
jgi:hypothetical protein